MSVPAPTLGIMAFASEHPVVAHSEYRPAADAVEGIVRSGAAFEVVSEYQPAGDQPAAIEELERRVNSGERDIVLLGATGTGKSATTAWLIERLQRPTLVMAPNKTLAAQLANELREMLPNNAVEYFVSYYDYYQPEAYIAQTDTYIEKDSSINDDVERLRHSATSSLLSRRDVVVVASVSCIYGLGTPQSYLDRSVELKVGDEVVRDQLLRLLVDVQYTRNDMSFTRGSFRVRGDTVEIIPSYEELAIRIEFFGDEVEALYYLHPLTGDVIRQVDALRIFPATHYVAGPERMAAAISGIEEELAERLAELENKGKLLEAQRLRMRTSYDIEMMRQVGFCSGIENYSRHIDGRPAGSAPATLLDYFPEDFLLVIDESHVTVPQIGGMYEGDMSRKRNLVDFGFRLPSATDNRPLTWEEFAERVGQTVYLSATPGPYELAQAGGEFVEQVIRPTGLVDPKVTVKPTKGQIDDLIGEIRTRTERDERVLVTTLTKKMAEDLTDYLLEMGIRVRYLHSEVDTLRRVELLRQLRLGEYDVLIGINLLREGLDLPEVSLVAILDADKEGFLRSPRSLIQTIGRAARNVSGEVHMYADKITDSMKEAIDETERRRAKQIAYNEERGIDPQPLRKKIADILDQVYREADDTEASESVPVGGSGRNASRGRRAQGEPGRAVSAGIVEGRESNGKVVITGTLAHRDGHSITDEIPLAIDASGSKNNVQGWGSSLSYGKRYATISLLNIISNAKMDEDRDGNDEQAPIEPVAVKLISAEDVDVLSDKIKLAGLTTARFCTRFNIQQIADLQTSAASHAQPLLERGLRLAVATGRPGVVHQWIERTGALTGRLNPLRPPANPELAERLTRLRALSQDEPSADELHERDQLLRIVREQSWMGEGAAELHDLVTVGQLQRELADCDATLIAFFSVEPDAFALLVTATSSRLVRVCSTDEVLAQVGGLPADLDLAAADLPPMIADSVVESLRERLSVLDDLILGPVRGRLRARRQADWGWPRSRHPGRRLVMSSRPES